MMTTKTPSRHPTSKDLLTRAQRMMSPALEAMLDGLGQHTRSDGPIDAHAIPKRLLDAMRYSLLSPGKRIRPALVIGGAEAAGIRAELVLPAACAVEMVHAYSLIHDDLPALDDDNLRRGRPSCHRAFDEATALLAGDALITNAFEILAARPTKTKGGAASPSRRASCVVELSRGAGAAGMVGGQVDDILHETNNEAALRSIHRRKTGRLIQAAAVLGPLYGGAPLRAVEVLRGYGQHLGLAFQLIDDVLDLDGLTPIVGPAAVRQEARRHCEDAKTELKFFARRSKSLCELADQMAERLR